MEVNSLLIEENDDLQDLFSKYGALALEKQEILSSIVGTPGSGFGPSGEGYLRLTAFNTLENTKEAMSRISKLSF